MISKECQCDAGSVKRKINKLISDPQKRHASGWLCHFEAEIHTLRNMLSQKHPLREDFMKERRSDGSPANAGSILHNVIADFEVKIVAVAGREFLKHGVGVGTYEYDGLKVLKQPWESLGAEEQKTLMTDITQQVSEDVFQDKANGCIRFVMKPMGYEDFRGALESSHHEVPGTMPTAVIQCCCCGADLAEADAACWLGCGHKCHAECMRVLKEEGNGCPNC